MIDDKAPRPVEAAEFSHSNLDIMMLLDTSLVGEMGASGGHRPDRATEPQEQMALVAFHSSADLIQDFTSSKQLLSRAVAQVKYGNAPHVLNALYAAIDGGFQSSTLRRVILLLTAGVEGYSRMTEKDVIRLARKTGGAIFNLCNMQKSRGGGPHGPALFEALRSGGSAAAREAVCFRDAFGLIVCRSAARVARGAGCAGAGVLALSGLRFLGSFGILMILRPICAFLCIEFGNPAGGWAEAS